MPCLNAVLMFFFLWTACSSTLPSTQVQHDLSGFFTHPWPSNTRLLGGRPDLTHFPNPTENPLIDQFIEVAGTIDGFGTNSPIYFPLSSTIDTTFLPTPSESISDESCVTLINIDPDSQYRGEIIPVQWDFQEEETNWQPANFLSVSPVWGFPLRPATQYAVVLTTELVNYDKDLP